MGLSMLTYCFYSTNSFWPSQLVYTENIKLIYTELGYIKQKTRPQFAYQSRHDVTVLVFILYITVTWKSNLDLQWTVIFATALAGLSTPLLAVHWYWITLSGVPGLVIFTILMDESWGKTVESPTRVHVITGFGLPEALQDNVKLLPSTTISVVLKISTVGATEE